VHKLCMYMTKYSVHKLCMYLTKYIVHKFTTKNKSFFSAEIS